ncbi:MAG: glycerophosphodiester phosphodiesterase [Chloroflexi bacterium]|nr:glycerophosphodiester phosphodiesterase [Chloroflexota bacterium]
MLVVGHRGAMGHRPENTMASFKKALEMRADLIEMDVHLSRDGRLVVIHDPTLERTTNGKGFVRDMKWAELARLDAGSWFGKEFSGESIPLLDDVIEWARGRIRLVIEIKNGPIYYPGIEDKLGSLLRKKDVLDSSIIVSFDHESIKKVGELAPEATTGVLYACKPLDHISMGEKAGACLLLPHWFYVTKEVVDRCHEKGLGVSPWGVNDLSVMEQLVGWGVDSIGTDYPDRLREVLRMCR